MIHEKIIDADKIISLDEQIGEKWREKYYGRG